jgi:type I restriction enzyme M protein
MLGAIIGDMVGSIYEFDNHRSKDFPLFGSRCYPTDDSIMTIAVAKAILENGGKVEGLSEKTVEWMQRIGQQYPNSGYGRRFQEWMYDDDPKPYRSYGNGAAMRVSACGWAGDSPEEVKQLSDAVTAVTHNHPEGIKGAEATACAIFLARKGHSRDEIRTFIEDNYYSLDFTLDEIRPTYEFNETCQETVPQAIEAFLESTSFEDAIRIAISVGGDSDTLACITGGIAEAFYKAIPQPIVEQIWQRLPDDFKLVLRELEQQSEYELPKCL